MQYAATTSPALDYPAPTSPLPSPLPPHRPSEVVWPLVVPHVLPPLLPLGRQTQVHEEQLLLPPAARCTQQEVLGLDLTG